MTIQFPTRIPFVESLGFELTAMADGQASVRIDLAAAHLNSWQVAHGGLVMTLLDVAMAHAAKSVNLAQPGSISSVVPGVVPGAVPGLVTVEMKTSFMRPATGVLSAQGRILHRSATMAFCEGSVVNEQGQMCAHATATFKYLRALPVAGRDVRSLTGASEGAGD